MILSVDLNIVIVVILFLLFIYMDIRYGIKDVLDFLFGWIPKLYRWYKRKPIKRMADNFLLCKYVDGIPYILDFVRNLSVSLYPLPGETGFNKYTDVIKYFLKYEAEDTKNGIAFLSRCIDIFSNDKEIAELIAELNTVLTDEQYANATPYDNFKKDLWQVLNPLQKLIEKRLDTIKRNRHLL